VFEEIETSESFEPHHQPLSPPVQA
jgi:hypothetical protein